MKYNIEYWTKHLGWNIPTDSFRNLSLESAKEKLRSIYESYSSETPPPILEENGIKLLVNEKDYQRKYRIVSFNETLNQLEINEGNFIEDLKTFLKNIDQQSFYQSVGAKKLLESLNRLK